MADPEKVFELENKLLQESLKDPLNPEVVHTLQRSLELVKRHKRPDPDANTLAIAIKAVLSQKRLRSPSEASKAFVDDLFERLKWTCTYLERLNFEQQQQAANGTAPKFNWLGRAETNHSLLSDVEAHLKAHCCPPGVVAVCVTGRIWIHKYFEDLDCGIREGKTDFIFAVKGAVDKLLARLEPPAITEDVHVELLLNAILALVELKTPGNLHRRLGACLAESRAEYLAMHFKSVLPHAADIDVPVILTDMNDTHLIQQSLPHHRGKVTCTTIDVAAVASEHIKQLLSAKLSIYQQKHDDILNFADPSCGAPGPSGAGNEQHGPSGPRQSKPAGGNSNDHAPPSKRMRTRASARADLDDLQLEALRLHSFRAAFQELQKPMSTIPILDQQQPRDVEELLAMLGECSC